MARRIQDNPQLDMTPMIDVVFELIIFFVVTIQQEDIFSRLNANRPAPSSSSSSSESDTTVTIEIGRGRDANGVLVYNKKEVRRGNGGFDGFQVAHFPHQDDIRVLTERAAECFCKGGNVRSDLTLDHNALFVLVVKFDRVLHRDDVAGAFGIDHIQQGGKSGGFTGPGRTGDKNQTAGCIEQVLDAGGKSQFFQREQRVGDLTQNSAPVTLLMENTYTETGLITKCDTKVCPSVGFHLFDLPFVGNAADKPFGIFRLQWRQFELRHRAVESDDRRCADFDMQVTCSFIDHELEQFIHFDHNCTFFRCI